MTLPAASHLFRKGHRESGKPVHHQFITTGDNFAPIASHKAGLRLKEPLVSSSLLPEFTTLKPLHCAYNSSTHFYRNTSLEARRKIKACNGSWKLNFSVTAQGKVELKDHWNGPASLPNRVTGRVDGAGKL